MLYKLNDNYTVRGVFFWPSALGGYIGNWVLSGGGVGDRSWALMRR
jgi:hypothetical protein